MNPTTIGMIQIIAGAACWGTLGILGITLKQLDFSSSEVAALRITLAFILLLPALPWLWPQLRRLRLHQLPMLALQSLCVILPPWRASAPRWRWRCFTPRRYGA